MKHVEQYLVLYQSSQDYLRLSRVHMAYLGGLRWSSHEDALVGADERTFAFSEAIAEFVEGFASEGRVIAFGCLLHWMDLMQNRRDLAANAVKRLHSVFNETGHHWRNAGAFAATLSADVPELPEPPDLGAVGKRLRNRAFPIRWFTSQFHESQYPPEYPPLAPAAFEADVIRKLDAYSEADLRTWLRTGRGPIRQANRLAEEPPLPRSLSRVLASLLERPRLAGAQTYVTQLVGALSLPPRRFVPQELPVGGYTDIVTRGQVEHLLPTQFALDDLEFVRRFAEKELLFFRREEPPAQNRQELVVLLDQGVRTWGDVRLVLAAATLAFGKQAMMRKTPFLLATTSNQGKVVEPTQEDEDMLGQLIEASDLSLHPGLALEETLQTSTDAMRDVVLLTHPRSLREDEVQVAARRLSERDRLFAVALDAHGQVEVSEIRHGTPIKLRQFHVDFRPTAPKPNRQHAGMASNPIWSGDVETIPYPFRIGAEPHVKHFDFDYAGQWLLTASGDGTLHLWKLDGTVQEILPRARRDNVLTNVSSMLGVRGGFVVLYQHNARLVAAHYDFVRRHVATYLFGPRHAERVECRYVQEHHSVIFRLPDRDDDYLIELDTGAGFAPAMEGEGIAQVQPSLPYSECNDVSARARDSWCRGKGPMLLDHNRHLPFFQGDMNEKVKLPNLCNFDPDSGVVTFRGEFAWGPFIPLADGKACFKHAMVYDVQLAGRTLAVHGVRNDIGASITLVRCPEPGHTQGAVLCEFSMLRDKHKIARHLLSYDGSKLAVLRSDHRVEVESITEPGAPDYITRVGGYTSEVLLNVGRRCILLNLGTSRQYWHLFDWNDGKLVHFFERAPIRRDDRPDAVTLSFPTGKGAPYKPGSTHDWPACCGQNRERYLSCVKHGLWYVLDRFGQVAVLDEEENVVAMFIAFRDRAAAWLPDGTCFGSMALSMEATTSDAAQKIARELTSRDREGAGK